MVETRGKRPAKWKDKILRYRAEPALWLRDTFKVELWEKQEQILNSVFQNRRTAVKSCYASGKSHVAGMCALAFVHLYKDARVITTAPSHRQLTNIWSPIHQTIERARGPLGTKVLQHELRLGPGWFAEGFTTDIPERIQGFHAPHVLIIVDESAGVDDEIHKRLEALMTGDHCHRLDIGNPHDPSGTFYDLFQREDVNKFTISSFDTPNLIAGEEVIPGLVTAKWVSEKRNEYGEDSPMWQVEVMGDFPPSAEDQLIPVDWVKRAQDRFEKASVPGDVLVHGLDPGGQGLAETVLCTRSGDYVFPLKFWTGLSGPEIILRCKEAVSGRDLLYIDSIGVGYSVVGYARDADMFAHGVNVGESPSDDTRFVNLRAELYWKLRDALDPSKSKLLALPPDDKLASQLCNIKYKYNTKGKLQIESKQEMRKRGVPSPDRADALMLTMASDIYSTSVPGNVTRGGMKSLAEELRQVAPFEYVEWGAYYH